MIVPQEKFTYFLYISNIFLRNYNLRLAQRISITSAISEIGARVRLYFDLSYFCSDIIDVYFDRLLPDL